MLTSQSPGKHFKPHAPEPRRTIPNPRPAPVQHPWRTGAAVSQATMGLLRPHKERCKTITFDNGKEVAEHAFIGGSPAERNAVTSYLAQQQAARGLQRRLGKAVVGIDGNMARCPSLACGTAWPLIQPVASVERDPGMGNTPEPSAPRRSGAPALRRPAPKCRGAEKPVSAAPASAGGDRMLFHADKPLVRTVFTEILLNKLRKSLFLNIKKINS